MELPGVPGGVDAARVRTVRNCRWTPSSPFPDREGARGAHTVLLDAAEGDDEPASAPGRHRCRRPAPVGPQAPAVPDPAVTDPAVRTRRLRNRQLGSP